MPHIALYNHAKWTDSQRPLQEKPKTLKIRHLIPNNLWLKIPQRGRLAETKQAIVLYNHAKNLEDPKKHCGKNAKTLKKRTLNQDYFFQESN